MKRRDFSAATLLGAGASMLTAGGRALAQGGPVEGQHYLRLQKPMPVSAPPGRFELIEFFWYGCPHCFAFEPALETWVRQLPPDAAFTRVPVAFNNVPFVAHQRIYFALEALGQVGAMHRKVFAAIHNERLRLDQPGDIAAFMAKNGIDAAKFTEAYLSFTTQAKVTRANQLVAGYQIDGVPALGVHGRYMTSGTLAGNNERALDVADFLLQRLRNSKS